MMEIKKLIVGSLSTNCYLLSNKPNKETIIVDPGDDADYIERIINDNDLIPQKIILTHGHYDHMLAAFELKNIYKIPLLISKKDEFLLKNSPKSAERFSKIKNILVPKIDFDLNKISKIVLGKNIFSVIETPGHTPGGICLHSEKEKIIFVGDLIFRNGSLGRCDFSYSSCQKLKESVESILKLPAETIVYSGHGPVFHLNKIKRTLES